MQLSEGFLSRCAVRIISGSIKSGHMLSGRTCDVKLAVGKLQIFFLLRLGKSVRLGVLTLL